MNDVIKQLVDQLGLDEAVAQQAVEIVLGVLKDKLPAPIADQLENMLDGGDPDELMAQLGGGDSAGGAGGIMGMLSGLLGKK